MNRSARAPLFLGAFASVIVLASACAEDPPTPALVEDLRILAIRAEPPELLVDRLADQADPANQQAVTFEALVMDPRGGPMRFAWSFCPVDSNQTCGDFDERRKHAPAALHNVLDLARAQTLSGEALPGELVTSPAGLERFTVPVAGELFAYHLADSGFGLGNGAWASAVLAVKGATETLTAQKRVVLAARDLAQWNPELAAFGWQICTGDATPLGCLPLRPRVPNRNPVFAGLEVARGALATAPFEPLEMPVTQPGTNPLLVAPGETLRLRPVFSADSEESFQTIESTLASDQLIVADHSEELIVSWFSTAGAFSDEQTARQLSKTLDNVFTAPAVVPPGGMVSVFLVARDQRGGVAWTQVSLQVQAP
ncbi:MAG TPA: hypothetical protein VGG33_11425 [Polyangia bacterium]